MANLSSKHAPHASLSLLLYSLLLFLSIFLYLWLAVPQYLLYQEQYQLFLFTRSYFTHAISIPGGVTDYISEFIVQFYYIPVYGALLVALVLTLSQVFLGLSCRRSTLSGVAYALSAIPSVLYLGAIGDENVLFSLAVAMLLTTFFLYLFTFIQTGSPVANTLIAIFGFTLLYWMSGPFAFVFIIGNSIIRNRDIIWSIFVAWLIVWTIHSLWFDQYSLSSLMCGINYYRIPEVYPWILLVIAVIMSLIPSVTLIKKEVNAIVTYIFAAIVAIFSVIYVPTRFNADKSRILAYDSLVRQGRWNDIIEKAKKEQPSDPFSLQALNLALGMTGQLPETMFHYNQNGEEGLIGRYRLDNTSQLVTAEALYRLGLTNIAFSTTFDLQEAIMNDRKSGRFMKRMAECMLINGNYDVAAKYIGFLSISLFYKDWAEKAKELLNNDAAVEAHPIYGPLRRNAFTQTAFYDPSQLDKILAILVNDSNGSNRLALDYFYATTMLKGDLATLIGVCNFNKERFGDSPLPRHVQEAIAMYWTFSHPGFEGIPFQINPDVQQQTATLAHAVMANKNNPAEWQKAAPDSYGIYFLSHANKQRPESTTPQYQSTHE